MKKETENNHEIKADDISYDFTDFEKRLQESLLEFNDKVQQSNFYKEPQHDLPMEKVVIPEAKVVAEKKASSQTLIRSSLLDSLAPRPKIASK
jgi:CRISPR/Cas system endoribonuclease Cas6 (RAMP superfamily)